MDFLQMIRVSFEDNQFLNLAIPSNLNKQSSFNLPYFGELYHHQVYDQYDGQL